MARSPALICLCLLWMAGSFLAIPHGVSAQESDAQDGDVRAYLELIGKMKEAPVETQIALLKEHLEAHPETKFRTEIETNLEQLERLLTATDPTRRKEARDAQRYLRAIEFAKKLSPSDQIALWEQFLQENPDSVYREEAQINLTELRRKHAGTISTTPSEPIAIPPKAPLTPDLPFKDPQKATLLATFPGLVVPGIGHWYTRDYEIAGVLTGLRVAGISVGIPAIINRNNVLIVVASLLYGFSYLADVIDAPFSARRYNDRLEAKHDRPVSQMDTNGVPFSLALNFSF